MTCCIGCRHFDLTTSPMRKFGLGLCSAETDPRFRTSRTFSGVIPCRFGNFQQATPAAVAAVVRELNTRAMRTGHARAPKGLI